MMRACFVAALVLVAGCFGNEGIRRYPAWRTRGTSTAVLAKCATLDARVVKSGKEGVGVTLEMRGVDDAPCTVRFERAALKIGDATYEASVVPNAPRLTRATTVFVYLAFAFDNDRVYHEGPAVSELSLASDRGVAAFALEHFTPERFPCEER